MRRQIHAFCPGCQKEAILETEGLWRRCTACGFEYQLDEPASPLPQSALGILVLIFKGVAYTLIGLAALAGLALAIAFVGCLVH